MSHRLHVVLAAVSTLVLAAPARAQCPEEPKLAHWNPQGSQFACPCFAANEEAGAVFTAPPEHYPIEVLKVRIAWGAVLGTPAPKTENSIRLYAGGLPNPGASPQFSFPSPVLTSGFLNEFDLESVAGNKVIASGPFTMTLRFATANANMIQKPSVISAASCQSGKNVIRFANGTWNDACSLGVSGNWVMEVTYRIANCDALNRDVAQVSLASGGEQTYTLAAGSAEGGKFYWILGSVSGTSPGSPFPGGLLPLNADPYTNLTLSQPFNPLFSNFFGSLDGDGAAFAAFVVPQGTDAEFAGVTLYHAYITIGTPGVIDTASNAVELLLAP